MNIKKEIKKQKIILDNLKNKYENLEFLDLKLENLQKLKKFVEEYGRLPKYDLRNSSTEENKLARFVSNYKYKKYKPLLDYLNKIKSEILFREQKSFDECFQDFKKFVTLNKRLPKTVKSERNLYSFYLKYKDKKDIIEFLSNVIYIKKDREKEDIEGFKIIKSWCNSKKRLPRKNADNIEEKSLYIWKRNLLARTTNKNLIKELKIFINKFPRAHIPREDRFNDLKYFINKFKILPSRSSNDPFEKSLGNWLSLRISEKDKEIVEYITQLGLYSPIISTRDWFIKFKLYVLINDKIPSGKSKDKEERSFYCGYINRVKRKTTTIKYPQIENFIATFKLYKEGDPKAIEIINLLKEKLGIK